MRLSADILLWPLPVFVLAFCAVGLQPQEKILSSMDKSPIHEQKSLFEMGAIK